MRDVTRLVEADQTFGDITAAVEEAIKETYGAGSTWLWVRDLTDAWAVYEVETDTGCTSWKVGYSIDDAGAVTLTGDPVEVEPVTTYEAREAVTRVDGGRILEAKNDGEAGARVYRVEVIRSGVSRNGVNYPAPVLQRAVPLYEGVKAFDHHRSAAEVQSSTITGLVGHYRSPAWNGQAIEADLHVLPSATHVVEALDASFEAQQAGLPPIVGISHDAVGLTVPKIDNGRRLIEATSIDGVRSADVVADPAAGGRVTRLVAGGHGSNPTPPTPTPPQEATVKTLKELLDALREASPEKRAELLAEHGSILTDAGFSADDVPTLLGDPAPADGSEPPAPGADAPAEDGSKEPALAEAARFDRDSLQGRALLREALRDAQLPEGLETRVREKLPERFTEAELVATARLAQTLVEGFERDGLRPRIPVGGDSTTCVGQEDRDKKVERLLETFRGNFQAGYARVSDAFYDVTGVDERSATGRDAFAHMIVRESWQAPTFSGQALRESITTTQWGEVLADAMNRRVVEVFTGNFAAWRQVANIVPVNDFRSQKLIEVSEYSTLPTVAEGGAYQPLTSATDKQETYSPTKKGGTESFTYEAARNDDIRVLASIPTRLGRLVAFTIYNTVFGVFTSNPTLASDSVALFHATHANTTASTTLSNAGLDTLRQKMRDQAAYGDTSRPLGLLPKSLLVPNELEDLANQLCRGNRGVPSTTPGASDVPNLHEGLEPIVVDIWTDANDYFLAADPMVFPGIEVGFLDGKVDPEIFVQDDPSTGTPFSSDEVTWKVRSIWGYGLTPSAYKAFQRMTN